MALHRFGYIKDAKDDRDRMFKIRKPVPHKDVDLETQMSAVEDQGNLGACVLNAGVALTEFLEKKTDPTPTDLSRLQPYYDVQVIEGTLGSDTGCQIRNFIKSAARTGICEERLWPYDLTKFGVKPSDEAYANAATHKLLDYERLTSLNDMLSCLASGYPFEFGSPIYASFEEEFTMKTGIVQMPKHGEEELGDHAECGVGCFINGITLDGKWYKEMLKVRNSWGPNVGVRGYFFFPFEYMATLARDNWVVYKASV